MEIYGSFRGGRWIEYRPSVTAQTDPRWTEADRQLAAAAFATAKIQGHSDEKAYQLSDAIVFQQMYKELIYDEDLRKQIQTIMRHVGTA